MHSSDQQLRTLLSQEESSQEIVPIAAHVEKCERCQNRLGQLTGVGKWTTELVNTLRDELNDTKNDASPTRNSSQTGESNFAQPLTVVLDQAAEVDDSSIEFDPVSLDFLAPPSHPELLGRLGRYEIERVIGAGGMGLVLKGFDAELHRPVAIKVLAPHLAHSAAARKRFAREAQATAAVIHPHVIPIHNVETSDKLPYLVMSYINGSSLQWYVDTNGPLSIEETLRIGMQTAAGMRAAHAQGLIHRDVKPANILLEEGTQRVVLSDFGLARTMDDASLTRTGIVTGTPHYMSPEQAGGEAIDLRSDLFSLGCVLYFMLTGRPPFRAATAMGVLNRICHEAHRPVREINETVPVPLAQVIDRLLAKPAADRYASAETLEQALGDILRALKDGRLKLARPKARTDSKQRGNMSGLRRWRVELVAVALLLCILPIVFWRPLMRQLRPTGLAGPSAPFPFARPASAASVADPWQSSVSEIESGLRELEGSDGYSRPAAVWMIKLTHHANDDLIQLEQELFIEERSIQEVGPRLYGRWLNY